MGLQSPFSHLQKPDFPGSSKGFLWSIDAHTLQLTEVRAEHVLVGFNSILLQIP